MNPDGTPLVADLKEKGTDSSEVKSFTSEDLEWALAKQKDEHDASLEALVQMRLDALTTILTPRGQLRLLLYLANNLLVVITLVFHGFMQDLK